MSVRARQALIVAAGLAVAAVMVVLGLWQMQRSIDSGAAGVRARAEQAAVPLLDYLHADGTTDDIYGKQATVTGEYLPAQQLLVGGPDGALRILTAFRVADGRVVPVVRGLAPGAVAPAPPAGTRTESGIFLPGEGDSDAAAPAGGLASVRTPLIAQRWPQRITPGFLTLDAAHASAQGLAGASVTLPQGERSLQNGSYALQWWLFAAFGLGMSIKLAHDVGERARRDADSDAEGARATVAGGPASGPTEREDD